MKKVLAALCTSGVLATGMIAAAPNASADPFYWQDIPNADKHITEAKCNNAMEYYRKWGDYEPGTNFRCIKPGKVFWKVQVLVK